MLWRLGYCDIKFNVQIFTLLFSPFHLIYQLHWHPSGYILYPWDLCNPLHHPRQCPDPLIELRLNRTITEPRAPGIFATTKVSGLASDAARGPGVTVTKLMMRTRRPIGNKRFIAIRIMDNNERARGGKDRVSECLVNLPWIRKLSNNQIPLLDVLFPS